MSQLAKANVSKVSLFWWNLRLAGWTAAIHVELTGKPAKLLCLMRYEVPEGRWPSVPLLVLE
jgi:hypothetical protein